MNSSTVEISGRRRCTVRAARDNSASIHPQRTARRRSRTRRVRSPRRCHQTLNRGRCPRGRFCRKPTRRRRGQTHQCVRGEERNRHHTPRTSYFDYTEWRPNGLTAHTTRNAVPSIVRPGAQTNGGALAGPWNTMVTGCAGCCLIHPRVLHEVLRSACRFGGRQQPAPATGASEAYSGGTPLAPAAGDRPQRSGLTTRPVRDDPAEQWGIRLVTASASGAIARTMSEAVGPSAGVAPTGPSGASLIRRRGRKLPPAGAGKTLRLQHTPVHVRDGTLSGRHSVGARHATGPASCPRRLEGSHPARGEADAIRRALRTRNTGAGLDKRGALGA